MLSNYKYGKCRLVDGILFNEIEIEPWMHKTSYSFEWSGGKCFSQDLMFDTIRQLVPGYGGLSLQVENFGSHKLLCSGNGGAVVNSSDHYLKRIYYLANSPHVLLCNEGFKLGSSTLFIVTILIPTVASKEDFERFLLRRFDGPFDLSLYYNTIPKHIDSIPGIPDFLHVFIQDCEDFDLVRDMLPIYMSKCGVVEYTVNLGFVSSIEKFLLMNETGINILRGGVMVRRSSMSKTTNIVDTGCTFELM